MKRPLRHPALTLRRRLAGIHPGKSHAAAESAFTRMEMVGGLAIIARVAAILLRNRARRISRANGEKEDQTLTVIGDGVQRYVRTYQVIPGQNSWTTNIS